MASSFYQAVFVVSLCAPIVCGSPPSAPSKGSPHPFSTESTPASQVSSSNTNFAFHLYRRLVLKTPGQNIFFSPVSVRINSYVEKETQGKVADLIQELEPQTAMVLVNYIFFKAKWEKPFNPQYTSRRYPFSVGKATVKVPMMHQEEQFAFGVDPDLNCSVLQMDYRGDTTAFFVLPSKGRLGQLEQALSSRTLKKWSHSLQKRWIEVFIPKFSMSTSYDLETVLPKMGIRNAFDKNADFSGITKRDFLQVSKVTHKAVLDVSEEGTEAAAATAAKLTIRSNDGSPLSVCFNRSFLLLIVDRATQTMLFLGKVENPSKV
ncbi:serpin A9 isoform X2 [Saccopteryx bilineata]|uniref:serpin A9 isoform X2 n=1 Tax=Saccopteryx bilineata TaxID=59482 RepID=UPI00338EEED6